MRLGLLACPKFTDKCGKPLYGLFRGRFIFQDTCIYGRKIAGIKFFSDLPSEFFSCFHIIRIRPAGGYGSLRRTIRMFTDKGSCSHRIETPFPHKRIEIRQGILERPVAIDGYQHGRSMVLTDYIVEFPFCKFRHVPAINRDNKNTRYDIATVDCFHPSPYGFRHFPASSGRRKVQYFGFHFLIYV